jgi:hypothetical protein
MRPPLARSLLAALLALSVLLAACGGSDDGDARDLGAELSDRFLRLGEDLRTEVEVFEGGLPPTLAGALNPGRTPETPIDDLVAIPVHPAGELLGSYRLRRTDGIDSFFLFYDVLEDDRTVEAALRQQLDQTPWQVIGGQSGESISTVRFRSTVSGDVDGQAAITPLAARETDDGDTTAVSNIIYIIQVQPADAPEPPPFVLPASREAPADFPLPFVLDGMDVLTVAWGTQPGATIYQATLLSPESAFDVADRYREGFVAAGWQLDDDRAVGFATVLAFSFGEGESIAQLTIDAFEQDDSFTSVQLRLQDGS